MIAFGPGRYDDLCTYVREAVKAEGAVVIVVGGTRGEGFSIQAQGHVLLKLPEILRKVADEIEGQILIKQ